MGSSSLNIPLSEIQEMEFLIWVPAPKSDVWLFLSNPRNFSMLYPKQYQSKIESEDQIAEGGTVVMEIRGAKSRKKIKLISTIQDLKHEAEGESSFDEVQVEGPFLHWRWRRKVFPAKSSYRSLEQEREIPTSKPGCWIHSKLSYQVSTSGIGKIFESKMIRPQVEELCLYQEHFLRNRFKRE